MKHTLVVSLALTAVAMLGAQQALAQDERADLRCQLNFSLSGWSALYSQAEGKGTVTCKDGSSLPVLISAKGGGLTAGKTQVDHGKGDFTHVRTIDDVAAGRAHETPQDDTAATYAPRLTKDDGRVDWTESALHVHDLIRGLHPWPHAVTFAASERLILHRSRPSAGSSEKIPGTVLVASGEKLSVATGDGTLDLVEIQVEGKRPMPVREFLAGRPLAVGTLLHQA